MQEVAKLVRCSNVDLDSIRAVSVALREGSGIRESDQVRIADFLEFDFQKIFKRFQFIIEHDAEFEPGVLATARPRLCEIIVRESIYLAAIKGYPSARVVLAHELGHICLSSVQSVRENKLYDLAFGDGRSGADEDVWEAEWQADEFAAEFLMPSRVLFAASPDEISERYGVSKSYVQRRLSLLRRRQERVGGNHPFFYEFYVRQIQGDDLDPDTFNELMRFKRQTELSSFKKNLIWRASGAPDLALA